MINMIDFNGETFLIIDDALEYLEDKTVIFHLKNLYIYYKGFATELKNLHRIEPGSSHPSYSEAQEPVYLECFADMAKGIKKELQNCLRTKCTIEIGYLVFQHGTVNGKRPEKSLDGYYCLDDTYYVDKSNIYAKKSELDYISDKYSIPKKISFKTNDLSSSNEEVPKNQSLNKLEGSDNEDNGSDAQQKEGVRIKDFIKGVIDTYPNADSNDYISHCFACYRGNNRALEPIKKIIFDLGIKYGGPGRRSKSNIEYMKTAPKYIPY